MSHYSITLALLPNRPCGPEATCKLPPPLGQATVGDQMVFNMADDPTPPTHRSARTVGTKAAKMSDRENPFCHWRFVAGSPKAYSRVEFATKTPPSHGYDGFQSPAAEIPSTMYGQVWCEMVKGLRIHNYKKAQHLYQVMLMILSGMPMIMTLAIDPINSSNPWLTHSDHKPCEPGCNAKLIANTGAIRITMTHYQCDHRHDPLSV